MRGNRTGKGQFKKGQSGNPGGRPKRVLEVQALAQEHTEASIKALAEIVANRKEPSSARVRAAEVLLDRGYGRAPQNITVHADQELTEALAALGNDDLRALIASLAASGAGDREGSEEAAIH